MPLEQKDDEQDSAPKERSALFKRAVEAFDNGYQLEHDTINVWNNLVFIIPGIPQGLAKLNPRKHYEEYVREIDARHNENGEYVALVMQRSTPARVAAFDKLADEFNADLERIKREEDFDSIQVYVKKAQELVYTK